MATRTSTTSLRSVVPGNRPCGTCAPSELWSHLLVVEQPVHRDHALSDAMGDELRAWPDRPPLIVDESDGAIGDVPRALSLGYAGASHKNCKGIVEGIANAAFLRLTHGRAGQPVLTGEDPFSGRSRCCRICR